MICFFSLKVEFDCVSLCSDSSVRCNIMENVLKSIASLVSHNRYPHFKGYQQYFSKGKQMAFLLNMKL